jgi:hypothetical protein
MSCKAAKFDPDEGRYYCDVSGDQCMYYIPNSKKCAEEYGEGPDAYDKLGDIISDYTSNSDVVFSEYLRSRLNSGELDLTDDEIKELLRLTGDDEYANVEDIREKHCCGECVHCDFEDYYDEETCDNISGYYCALDREEFDYDNGCCDQHR